MSTVFTGQVTLETIECCNCGVTFAMPASWLRVYEGDPNRFFYCPAGHPQHFSKSTATKLREEIERKNFAIQEEIKRSRRLEQDLRSQKFKTQSAQMHAAKLKKRIKNGVCPCCQRTFKNLAEHMDHMHPDFAKP